MALYISLLTFTQKGVEAVKEQGDRINDIKAAYKAAGGELIAYYATMGQYDGVVVYRMPDDVAAASFILSTMSRGNVRSETMRAFDEGEYRSVLKGLR